MKSPKDIFRNVVVLTEGVKEEIHSVVRGDSRYESLRKAAMSNDDKIIDFIDYVFNKYNDSLEAVMKKHRITYDELSEILLGK